MHELDLLTTHADRAYPVLSSLVTPRPIAWVTTLNEDGSVNAAPFSFFNVFGSRPPLVIFAPGNRADGMPKDTARNCEREGEFVVNLVSEEMREAMVGTAAPLDFGESELESVGLGVEKSASVGVPRIAGVPAALECRLHEIQRVGENRLVLGIVHRVQVADAIFDPETLRVRGECFHPVGRMASPDWYCRTRDLFEIKRPG